jgi:hypothetical protein
LVSHPAGREHVAVAGPERLLVHGEQGIHLRRFARIEGEEGAVGCGQLLHHLLVLAAEDIIAEIRLRAVRRRPADDVPVDHRARDPGGEEDQVLLAGNVSQGLGQRRHLQDEVLGLALGLLAPPIEGRVARAPFSQLGRRRLGRLPPIFLLDLGSPPGHVLDRDVRQGFADLFVVRGQELVDGQAAGQGIGDQPDLVARLDVLLQEFDGGLEGLARSALRVEGEVEEKEIFSGEGGALRPGCGRRFLRRGRRGDGSGVRLDRGPGEGMPLELGQDFPFPVVDDDELVPGQVGDGIALAVDDINLEELEGHDDLVLDRPLLDADGLLAAGEGRQHGQNSAQEERRGSGRAHSADLQRGGGE